MCYDTPKNKAAHFIVVGCLKRCTVPNYVVPRDPHMYGCPQCSIEEVEDWCKPGMPRILRRHTWKVSSLGMLTACT